jgi:hypothetical protein
MTREEVAVLLAVLSVHEPFLTNDSVAVATWMDTLDAEITAEFARHHVAYHYSQPDAPRLTCGGLNAAWRKLQRPDPTILAIEEAQADAVPMPDWFRQQFDELTRKVLPE